MRTHHRIVDLPELYRDPDVTVATRLDPEAGVVRHVVQVVGGASSRETTLAIARARENLRNIPEQLRDVEVILSPASRDAILAAQRKRERKAARAAGRKDPG